MRRSSDAAVGLDHGVGGRQRRVGDDVRRLVGQVGSVGVRATVGVQADADARAAGQHGEHAAYGVGAGVLGDGQLAADDARG